MLDWYFIGGLAATAALLAGRSVFRRRHQDAAADAAGLAATRDLSHVPEALQHTALWSMAEGGFERRVVHGIVSRGAEDIAVTAFDLETLREQRGEWAFLPVEPPFRIAGAVSVVVCEIDRVFPHYVLKRFGRGDEMRDDGHLDRSTHVGKLVRDGLGMARQYPSELPAGLDPAPLAVPLADHWRAYGRDDGPLNDLVSAGFNATLEHAGRRDLVVELLERIVVVYPAARDVVGADAFADLTATALMIVEGILACSPVVSPRGLESRRREPAEITP